MSRRWFGSKARSRGVHGGALLTLCALGCGDSVDPRRPAGVLAEVSPDITTVLNVSWRTDEDSIGYVEYGATEALGQTTPLEETATREHRVSLLGLNADTVYYYRVVTWDGDDAARSSLASARTGDLPIGLPALTHSGEGHDQFTLVPILGATTAVIVIDPKGEIVWYHTDDRELDFYRARLSRDGTSIIYNAASVSGSPADNSELVRVSLDGSSTSSIPVPLLTHDFIEMDDGTLGAIVAEYRDFEGQPLRGDKIVEIAPDGTQTTVWSAWDCFDPAVVQGDTPVQGWMFANALDYDPGEDVYYLGMRNFSSIAKIKRASGECEWVLGLVGNTFEFASGSARFLHQHQFQVRGDHILIMDNDGSPGRESRVLEYQLDIAAKVATQVWSYVADPTVYTFVLGEPIRFDDGGTFINWSAAGQMERLTASGEVSWKVNTSAGYAFGFNTLAPSLYPPRSARP
ncbi:MAG TPA: aryl-sulfate sulfotransferase [Polyangiaceae bacterium]|nr:aryl-sulfate sulfotransferase [Polyangiaceae bacterium]